MSEYWPHLVYAIAGYLAFRLFLAMTRSHERATWKRLKKNYEQELERKAREEAEAAAEEEAAAA